MARIIDKTAFNGGTFTGWRVSIEGPCVVQAEALAAPLGHIADIQPTAQGFDVLVIADPSRSAVLSIHERYEAAGTEYTRLDHARAAMSAEMKAKAGAITDTAQHALLKEQDALRLAILRQTPGTWEDAATLAFHAANSYDLIADAEGEEWNRAEGEALRYGLNSLFAFIVAQKVEQPDALGEAFAAEVARVRWLRNPTAKAEA
ncbi:hypothetical protein [Sphingomonas sp.]|uniref:hypothetical protein n=1 Tax=Sphingomonas sp. TaxID=28214 RepID=UPI003BAB648B